MHNFVVVVFRDEGKANEGVRALQDLHREGSVTVYATAALQREANGELSVKRHSHSGPLGFGAGALAGGLIGVAGGPAGPAAGAAAGAVVGSLLDGLRAGLGDELLDRVQRDLTPGASALVAEVSEESPQPIDARMGALGGQVTRRARQPFAAGLVEEDTSAFRADLAELSAKHAAGKAELMQSKLDVDLENARDKLQRAAETLHERVDRVREELGAKLEVLRDQAARADPAVREQIQRRIGELTRDLAQREEALKRAYELTEAALH